MRSPSQARLKIHYSPALLDFLGGKVMHAQVRACVPLQVAQAYSTGGGAAAAHATPLCTVGAAQECTKQQQQQQQHAD